MNSRTTLILAIVFAIVSGVYIAGELAKNKKAEKELKEKRIFTITPEKATSVTLAKSREAIRFEKKDGIWIITSPERHLAKNWDFGNMLYLITELKKDEVIRGGDPAEFGLRPPSLIVTVSDGEKEETLLLGRRNYTGVSAYAKLDGGDDVFMVSSIGVSDAEGKLGSFIDRGLLSCEPDKCDKLTIRNGTESMELIQKDGKWSMSKPAKRKIDGGKVLVYLQALSGVEGGDVREGSEPAAPEKESLAFIKAEGRMPERAIYVMGEAKDGKGFNCIRKPVWETMTITREAYENFFLIKPDRFDDTRIFSFECEDAAKAKLSYKGKTLLFEKKREWEHEGNTLCSSAVNTVMWEIEDLSYKAPTDLKGEKVADAEITGKDGKVKAKFSVEEKDGKTIIVNENGRWIIEGDKIAKLIELAIKEAVPSR